jgi:hypothetical protein
LNPSTQRARWTTLALAAAIFLVNVYICRELFRVEYLNHMNSIEGAFIGISRYAMAHFGDLKWFPLWLEGIPYSTTYPPLLHLVVAFAASLFHTSSAHAYHAVTALIYCLGPVALFALALRLSGSRWVAFAAGLIYSCVTFSAWLIPVIKTDLGSIFFARRLQALALYGEGPHVSSMTLLTLSILFLDIAIAKRRAVYFSLAAVFFGATVADNWLGAFGTVLFVIPFALAKIGGRDAWRWRDFAYLGAIATVAYCLIMPLVPPMTIQVMVDNARTTGGDYTNAYRSAIPQFIAIVVILILIKLAARKLNTGLQFAILLTFVMMLVTLADAYYQFAIVPMGLRYHLEMELALSLLIALMGAALLRNRPKWIGVAVMIALCVILIHPIRKHRQYARNYLLRSVDITTTAEWRMAQYFNLHWPGKESGERVFMPGSAAFWFNAFADTPQVWGFDQSATDYAVRVADYGITTGQAAGEHDAEYSVLWLKALGAHAVGVTGPKSTEVYHPFLNPAKFEGKLDTLWRDGDDVIYQVGKHAPLARVVPRSSLANRMPINAIDIEPLRPYVAALDDPTMPSAEFHWTTMHSTTISTELRADQVVSIQMAWHKGWHSSVNGHETPLLRDGIGLMYIEPAAAGHADIEMHYDGGMEMRFANFLSPLTAIVLLLACVWQLVHVYLRQRVILKKVLVEERGQ